jgi:thiamine kinase-like enzyme
VQVDAIVARLWPGESAVVEPLGGGITNTNFKVRIASGDFVVRIAGEDTELLGIDRRAERAATVAAASVGVGPEVVAFLEEEGVLVTRFVDGRAVPPAELASPPGLDRVASALRLVHGGPPVPARFDSFRVVERYRETAEQRGVEVPAGYERAHALACELEERLGARPRRPCHNDLLSANFVAEGGGLRIVDWEYAGMGDPAFDLGNFAANNELDEAAEEILAERYGLDGVRELAAVRVMRYMSDFREAMWGVVQQGISQLDFDFAGYARRHFERMELTAASASFRRALRAL